MASWENARATESGARLFALADEQVAHELRVAEKVHTHACTALFPGGAPKVMRATAVVEVLFRRSAISARACGRRPRRGHRRARCHDAASDRSRDPLRRRTRRTIDPPIARSHHSATRLFEGRKATARMGVLLLAEPR